jgi:hypothetical protein
VAASVRRSGSFRADIDQSARAYSRGRAYISYVLHDSGDVVSLFLRLLTFVLFIWAECASPASAQSQGGSVGIKGTTVIIASTSKPVVRIGSVSGFTNALEVQALTEALERALAEEAEIRVERTGTLAELAQYSVDFDKVDFKPGKGRSAGSGRCAGGKLALTVSIKDSRGTATRSLDLTLDWPGVGRCNLPPSELQSIIDAILAMHFAQSVPMQLGGDTSIKGATTISATASEVTTIAAGSASMASNTIGAITGSKIDGATEITATAKSNPCGEARIGAIDGDPCSPGANAMGMGRWGRTKGLALSAGNRNGVSGLPARSIEGLDNAPFIPWPPPDPTSMADVTSKLTLGKRYGEVAVQLARRLTTRGYEDIRYFRAGDQGFAMTTDLERLDDKGNIATQRWETGKITSFAGMLDYARSLVMGKRGNFRLFAFVVIDGDLQPDNKAPDQAIVESWQARGRRQLSAIRAAVPVSKATRVYLLVYEFMASNSKGEDYKAKSKGRSFSFHASALGLR